MKTPVKARRGRLVFYSLSPEHGDASHTALCPVNCSLLEKCTQTRLHDRFDIELKDQWVLEITYNHYVDKRCYQLI